MKNKTKKLLIKILIKKMYTKTEKILVISGRFRSSQDDFDRIGNNDVIKNSVYKKKKFSG